jgi:hypothetical protein
LVSFRLLATFANSLFGKCANACPYSQGLDLPRRRWGADSNPTPREDNSQNLNIAWFATSDRRRKEFGDDPLQLSTDDPIVPSLVKRLIVLHHGAMLSDGPPAEVLKDAAVIKPYLGTKFGKRPEAEFHQQQQKYQQELQSDRGTHE